jgi:phosphoadenosine phosphosulfate reductase
LKRKSAADTHCGTTFFLLPMAWRCLGFILCTEPSDFVELPTVSEFAQPRAASITPFDDPSTGASSDRSIIGVHNLEAVANLASSFGSLDLFARLTAIRNSVRGRVVFTTSFGLEDQAITHALFSQRLDVDVVTLDTGRLFPETHEVWAKTERRYVKRIVAFTPDRAGVEALIARQGIDGMRSSVAARLECCAIRKVEPLARVFDGAAAWITGLRADQSSERAHTSLASFDEGRGLIKINPLFDWTREQAVDFVGHHHVPYNALHDRGFLSIGCAPCTRAVAPGEPERAGRWWWEREDQKECGLHIASDGRVYRAASPNP